ncbi:MAG TPA: alpha/beta fold hydrolase [Noviherbaspirillum sp.]|nr:alpha/beta fold hydrolase [Noviherbaspirillum sp.]
MHLSMNAVRWWYESLDRLRRQRGLALDRLGLGPVQVPYRTVKTHAGVRLRHYGGEAGRPVALIVPAPIKRPYIWDLAPGRSVVRGALGRGLQVYLAEWTDPAGPCAHYGLEDYGYALLEHCVAHIAAGSRGPLFLLGHSLGGVFAAIYAALRPERVAGLVTLETPLHFGDAAGSFFPLLAFGPRAPDVARWFDAIPGSVLNQISITASPSSFQAERYADFVASLDSWENLQGHWQVQRWTLDEAPMARHLFEDVVEQLYREDHFMQGRLHVHGKVIGPRSITCPFLAVFDPRSLIIPLASIVDFLHAAASTNKRLLAYRGDVGIALAHVGVLTGRNAHDRLWPQIFDWIEAIGAGNSTGTTDMRGTIRQ